MDTLSSVLEFPECRSTRVVAPLSVLKQIPRDKFPSNMNCINIHWNLSMKDFKEFEFHLWTSENTQLIVDDIGFMDMSNDDITYINTKFASQLFQNTIHVKWEGHVNSYQDSRSPRVILPLSTFCTR